MTPAEMALSGVVALMGGGGFWLWLTGRGKHHVDLITLGQSIAASTITAMKADRDELLTRISGLEDQITALKEQVHELLGHAENLEATLKKQGIEPPARPRKRL